jgi:hypothetical protein
LTSKTARAAEAANSAYPPPEVSSPADGPGNQHGAGRTGDDHPGLAVIIPGGWLANCRRDGVIRHG